MNKLGMFIGSGLAFLTFNAEAAEGSAWAARSLGEAVWHTVLFGLLGIVLAIVGYKLFDLVTPGKLHHEILQNKNVAAAIIGAAVIIGVCLLVAAAMLG